MFKNMIHHPAHPLTKRPIATGGVILLVLGLVGLVWLWPEIQRYIKMERM